MSHTIFGNKTKNGITIDDMIDNNNDIIYNICDNYFVRLVNARDNIEDEPRPAIAVFSNKKPYFAIFAKMLSGSFEMYWDGLKTTNLFKEELDKFVEDFRKFIRSE